MENLKVLYWGNNAQNLYNDMHVANTQYNQDRGAVVKL